MIEIESSSNRGFAYGKDGLLPLKDHPSILYKLERAERMDGVFVFTLAITAGDYSPANSFSLTEPGEILCRHGNRLEYRSLNRLPNDGWEELVDCWSCHNNEFKSVLDLKMRPREGGLLVSNFYLISHEDVLPACCKGKNRLFYNEISTNYSDQNYIYKYFKEYFEGKNVIVIELAGTAYAIKFFYECILITDKPSSALKIGISETERPAGSAEFINGHYKSIILEQIKANMIGIKVLGYDLSFIVYN